MRIKYEQFAVKKTIQIEIDTLISELEPNITLMCDIDIEMYKKRFQRLDKWQKNLLSLRMIGYSFREIGEMLGVSHEMIRNKIKEITKTLTL